MKYILYVFGGIVGLSVFGLLLKVVLFPVNVANTAINSATGVIEKTLDSNNVIANYEWFYDVNAKYESRVNQIKGHKTMLQTEEDKQERSRINMELAAMRQSCRDLVTMYDANTEKANRSLFKSKGLPETLILSTCEG